MMGHECPRSRATHQQKGKSPLLSKSRGPRLSLWEATTAGSRAQASGQGGLCLLCATAGIGRITLRHRHARRLATASRVAQGVASGDSAAAAASPSGPGVSSCGASPDLLSGALHDPEGRPGPGPEAKATTSTRQASYSEDFLNSKSIKVRKDV